MNSLLAIAEARRLALEAVVPIARTQTVTLEEADGRVLATDVVAGADVPPFDRAVMDGFAVRAADTAGATPDRPRSLTVTGRVFGGDAMRDAMAPGSCVAIATGAPLPAGADAVVMVERTTRRGATVDIHGAVAPGQHVGRQGGDIRTGDRVLTAGTLLSPAQLGALAATGLPRIEVFARPAVTILSTGPELVPPGQPLGPGQIHEVNRYTLGALVARHGGTAVAVPAVADTTDAVVAALAEARGRDLIVCSGGSSVGERDLVLDVLRAEGEVLFHGVAAKPGKPTGLARLGSTPCFALPGNPTSCLVMATVLVVPFLRRLARLPPWQPRVVRCPLARSIHSTGERHVFYSVRIENGQAVPAFKGSGEITSLAYATGYIEVPIGTTHLDAGHDVDVTVV